VLGAERQIIANYVETGKVKIVFWPMLDFGNASHNAHAAADCAGRQNATAFWLLHDEFFEKQHELWQANRDYFVNAAVRVGLDQETFAACYDNRTGHDAVSQLDAIRRQRGIFNRPTIDINGHIVVGNQRYENFAQLIDTLLAGIE
jgi:protein-disulfide isomerase